MTVIDFERKVFQPIAMISDMSSNFFTRSVMIGSTEFKYHLLIVFNDMMCDFSFSSFKSLVRKILKPKPWSIKWSSLLGITDIESNMIYIFVINYLHRVFYLPSVHGELMRYSFLNKLKLQKTQQNSTYKNIHQYVQITKMLLRTSKYGKYIWICWCTLIVCLLLTY